MFSPYPSLGASTRPLLRRYGLRSALERGRCQLVSSVRVSGTTISLARPTTRPGNWRRQLHLSEHCLKLLSTIQVFSQILVSEPTKNLVESVTSVERTSSGRWKLRDASTDPRLSENLLFPSQRRFSLMTVNQAVNRLLQTTATPANEAGLPKCTVNVRRRKYAKYGDYPVTFNV